MYNLLSTDLFFRNDKIHLKYRINVLYLFELLY